MIEIMESWFLADRDALARHFGEGFKAAALPGNPARVESIPKRDVEQPASRSASILRAKVIQ